MNKLDITEGSVERPKNTSKMNNEELDKFRIEQFVREKRAKVYFDPFKAMLPFTFSPCNCVIFK
jgi:hypothetical protein